MNPQMFDSVIARCSAVTAQTGPAPRRRLLGYLGLLLGGGAATLSLAPADLDAKKKKKKGKKKDANRSAQATDYTGSWRTQIEDGPSGFANFVYNSGTKVVTGTYSNSDSSGTRSGTLWCEVNDPSSDGKRCDGEYAQNDGETGGIAIELQDKNHWYGGFVINGSNFAGSWSGVRL